MLIDGVKWACDACIRGHRVSGCSHHDRELRQIAKKGRPVSQCPHCRHLRKSKAAHVKCDCGERHAHGKEQAAKKTAAGGCCGTNNVDKSESKSTHQCSCCHGGRCTCALKKESSLDTVPEFPHSRERKSSIGRPRLQATQSEGSLTTFANGHHKPTHKSHHGVHGVSPYTILGHADHHRHSFLDDEDIHPPVTPRHRRMKSVSDKSSIDLLSLSRAYTTGNPLLGDTLELTSRQPSAMRQAPSRIHSGLSVNTNQAQFPLHENLSQDFLQSAGSDVHQFSAGLQPSSGWPSFQQFELDWAYPGLTSSSSGDENDELNMQTTDIAQSLTGTGPLPSEASDLGDETYRLSAASSFIGLPQLAGGSRLDEYNVERYLVDFLPMETTKLNLERYLLDGSLNFSLTGDSGYEDNSSFFSYINQPLHESTDTLDLLASSKIHSPTDTGLLLNMSTPLSPEDEGMVWMRKFSNASTYQSTLDQSWHTQSQAQSPR